MSLEVRLPSLHFLYRSTLDVVLRFPASIVAAGAATASVMCLIQDGGDPCAKLWMMAQLGLPLFTAIAILKESRSLSSLWYYLLLLAGVLALGGYYYVLDLGPGAIEDIIFPRYLAFLLAAHLAVSVIPYLNRGRVEDFWEFNKELFSYFITGGVFTLILWAGLSAALLAIKELFDLPIDGRVYGHLMAVLAGLFQTIFFLHHVPKQYSFEEKEVSYHLVISNLCKYILIPIVTLYFLILYVYGAQILLTWTLPRGWVGSLVIGFSVAGIFTYLLNYLLPRYDQSPAVRYFHRWFWPVLLPLVLLLFVAIGRRISDYGVTEARFIVAHTGLWLLVVGLYFVISRTDNIRFIPVSLGAFALVAVLGPFSAFQVAQRSQVSELKALLQQYGRLEDGKVKASLLHVPEEDAQRIRSTLGYLEDRKALWRIEPWFNQPLDSLELVPRTTGMVPRIINSFGMQRDQLREAATIHVAPNQEVNSGNIRGYTTFYRLDLYDGAETPGVGRYVDIADNGRGIAWREKKGTRWIDLEVFDLDSQIADWLNSSEDNYYYLKDGETTIDFNGKRAEMRLVLFEVSLFEEGDSVRIRRLNGLLFLKDKVK